MLMVDFHEGFCNLKIYQQFNYENSEKKIMIEFFLIYKHGFSFFFITGLHSTTTHEHFGVVQNWL